MTPSEPFRDPPSEYRPMQIVHGLGLGCGAAMGTRHSPCYSEFNLPGPDGKPCIEGCRKVTASHNTSVAVGPEKTFPRASAESAYDRGRADFIGENSCTKVFLSGQTRKPLQGSESAIKKTGRG